MVIGDSEPAEVVVLIVVAVPSAVVLLERDAEDDRAFDVDRLIEVKDGRARLIASPGATVDAPGGVAVAVDGEFHRAGDALVLRLVVIDRFEIPDRLIVIRRGIDKFQLYLFLLRIASPAPLRR